MKKYQAALLLFLLALLPGLVQAGGREALYHQGFVIDQQGDPIDGTLPVTFRLYELAAGGEPLWEENDTVTFSEGVYTAELGEATVFPNDLFDHDSLYLGIQVAGDNEMSPRLMLSSVPWAHQADVAITAQSLAENASQDRVLINGFGEVIDKNGNWVGPTAGLAGTPGPAGPAGAQGLKGETGLQGAPGAVGPSSGLAGPQGPQGPKGDQGNGGITGPAGPQGTSGLQGSKGDKGDVGVQGLQGSRGEVGPAGTQGPTGLTGTTGSQGLVGETGIQGQIGPVGPSGSTGAKGDIGPQGLQGLTGTQGPKGDAGVQGLTGATGLQGETGPQGLQGLVGATGSQGAIGETGIQGLQGIKGDKGEAGEPAPSSANYAFAYDTTTQSVALANVFQDITFNTNAYLNGWQHTAGTAPFTCNQTGLYRIDYRALANGGLDILSLRTALNGAEIPGSQASFAGTAINTPVTQSFIVAVNAGDNLSFQLTGNTALNQQLSGGHGAGTVKPSITATILRIQ